MADLRPYRLGDVAKWRNKLYNHASVRDYIGSELRGQELHAFVDQVHRLLPKGTPRDLVFASLRHLAGKTLSDEALEDIAWQFAGNLRRFCNLRPVLPWKGQRSHEWVPVQVVGGDHYRTKRSGKVGMIYTFQVLAGTPCPLEMTQFWSRNFCRMLSRRLGFTKHRGPRPFTNVTEFMNLRMYVLVDPEKCQDGKPGFSQVHEEQPSSVVNYNRQLLQWRQRSTKDFQCPQNYPKRHRCFQCHVGLDVCPAATHERTFVRQECPNCHRHNWHDPAFLRMCVDCRVVKILHPKEEQ